MNDTALQLNKKKHINYEFISEGLNGRIRKAIIFNLIDPKREIYNLGFGDYNEVTNEVDDLSVSNNQDRDKILATVAAAVIDFSEKHPTATVIALGSSESRTRLYRMGITKYFENIPSIFHVEGYNRGWKPFQKGHNYEAFSIRRKMFKFTGQSGGKRQI